MGHLGDLSGVHVVLAADPLGTAARLAEELGAELVRSPIEVHLALEERRRAAREEQLRAAGEARALAADLVGHDGVRPRELPSRAVEIRSLPLSPQPGAALEQVQEQTAAMTAAAGRLDAAVRELETVRAGLPAVDDGDRALLLRLEPHAARAIAAEIRTAAEDVRDAQRQLGPRPTVDAATEAELERASAALRRARLEVAGGGRRLAIRLIQAAGISLVAVGLCVNRRLPVALTAAVAAVPMIAAVIWSLRVAARDRRRRSEAERRADTTVVRLLGGHAAAVAGPGADPVDVLEQLRARWNARAQRVAEADARLADAHRRWSDLAGHLDPDTVEELLDTAAALRRGEELVERAAAAVANAERDLDVARRAWAETAQAAGAGVRSPEEASAVLAELEARVRLRRPIVLADPLSDAEEARRDALRRQLAETEFTCVIVTALPEAATWGFPVFDTVLDSESREASETQGA